MRNPATGYPILDLHARRPRVELQRLHESRRPPCALRVVALAVALLAAFLVGVTLGSPR